MLHRQNSSSNVQNNNTLIPSATQNLLSSKDGKENNVESIVQPIQQLHTSRLTPPPNNSVLKTSRYEEDFCEKEKVGKGGYGSVYKVQNKLDGLFYALKKIPFKNTSPQFHEKVLREVKTLALLNHRNIVRYHSAWLETDSLSSSNGRDPYQLHYQQQIQQQLQQQLQHQQQQSLYDGNWGTTSIPQNSNDDFDSPPFEIDSIDRKLKSPLNKSSTIKKSNTNNNNNNNNNNINSSEEEDSDGYDHSLNKLQFPTDFEEEFRQIGRQASIRESMFKHHELSDDESTNPNSNSSFGFYKNPSKKKSGSTFSLDSMNNSEFTEEDSEHSESESESESEQESESESESIQEEEEESESGYLNSDSDFNSDSENEQVDQEDNITSNTNDFIPNPKLITSTTPPISMPSKRSSIQQTTPTLLSSSINGSGQNTAIKKSSQSLKTSTSPPKSLYRLTTLYIVMQLYSQTLGQWLENRPYDQPINEVDNLNIFKQICIGLRYIHSKGIIHRDLKPGNIFLVKAEDSSGSPAGYSSSFSDDQTNNSMENEYGDLLVSLGDFGLAVQHVSSTSPTPSPTPTSTPSLTPVNSQILLSSINGISPLGDSASSTGPPTPSLISQSLSSSTSSTTPSLNNTNIVQPLNINNNNNTANLSNSSSSANITGTSLSRSMEHFKHTSAVGTMTYSSPEQKKCLYNEKTDIYSLGIILFELYCPFSTKMEKARVLSDLKNRILPKSFLQNHPKIADLVLNMMKPNPDERPSAADILKSDIFGQILSVSEMEYIIKHQQNIIEQLKQQIYQLKSPLLNSDDVAIY